MEELLYMGGFQDLSGRLGGCILPLGVFYVGVRGYFSHLRFPWASVKAPRCGSGGGLKGRQPVPPPDESGPFNTFLLAPFHLHPADSCQLPVPSSPARAALPTPYPSLPYPVEASLLCVCV